ncbi:uncharacterized protein LACBIDRAFT_333279 [Laccaria bicolor S238N-H82]|uniref:Predicted protein n=1 Tax=Laccaria bicolor (strain S238N-H82 / ATCC MYA-4686) TaxID=486041 RepID=B0DVG0_LACBS|nr:uncharacterized protein LACBIDRAFT_333279 [Laccaria bicolor S238N-H82]EDR01414.1 predicted protein [Laccaria bicolor S238N-H82]|eukprot:XP_001887959.1 predicted protein [Laccaria bicolor S238N-H82]
MPRRSTHSTKSGKLQVERLERKCRYCKTYRSAQGFDKHEAWCKKTSMIRKELPERTHSNPNEIQVDATPLTLPAIPLSSRVDFGANNEFVEGSSLVPMDVDYPSPELNTQEPTNGRETMYGPHLPQEYIKIIPHPHSWDPTTKIIALNHANPVSHSECPTYMPQPEPHPWAPFKNLGDFEYTETAIMGLLPKWIINKQLAGLNSNWAEGSHLTIKNFTEMDNVLSKACKYFVQFKHDIVTALYQDPWEWILSIIQDESLAPMAMWNAVQKYHCAGDFEEQIYDEPNTAV